MFKHYFEQVENVEIWPIISLAIFFGFFISLLLWVFTANKKYIKRMKNMPLENEDQGPKNGYKHPQGIKHSIEV